MTCRAASICGLAWPRASSTSSADTEDREDREEAKDSGFTTTSVLDAVSFTPSTFSSAFTFDSSELRKGELA